MPERDDRKEREYCTHIGLALLSVLLLTALFQTVAGFLAAIYVPQLLQNSTFTGAQLVIYYPITLPVAWLLVRNVPHQKPEKRRLGADTLIGCLAAGYVLLYFGGIVGTWLNDLLYTASNTPAVDVVTEVVAQMNMGTILLCACLFGPIAEEILFRRLLCGSLTRYGQKQAILVSALLFGLYHGNLTQFVYAFLLGLLLGYVYLSSGHLLYAIGLHIAINLLGSALPIAVDTYGNPTANVVFGMLTLALLVGGMIALVQLWRRRALFGGERAIPLRVLFGNAGMVLALIACLSLFALNYIHF